MIKLELQGQQYDFPQSWEEVTFDQYVAINKIDELNDVYKVAQIISIFSGIHFETILDLPFNEFVKIDIKWVENFKLEGEQKNEWLIDGVTYKINSDFDAMTVSEFVDCQQFSKSIDTYDKLLAVILRPSDEKYNSKLTNQRSIMLREKLNALDVYKITVFFLSGEKGFLNNLMIYLSQQQERQKQKMTGE